MDEYLDINGLIREIYDNRHYEPDISDDPLISKGLLMAIIDDRPILKKEEEKEDGQ